MGADQQARAQADWWAAAADRLTRRTLAPRPMRGRRDEYKTMRVTIVISMFLALLATALLVGGHAVIDPLLQAAADAREANRIGEIVYTMPDGEFCRHLSFDNMTGELSERAIQLCSGENIARPRTRSAVGFAWGQR
jgi:hypothetical protein